MKLDVGCGPNKAEGFVGIDVRPFKGVDHTLNAGRDTWPFEDNSVEEARSSHFVEHLDGPERVHFVNELYRVMKPGAKCQIVCPWWASGRAYGDVSHKWPPVSGMFFFYLSKEWRKVNAPHDDSDAPPRCDGVVDPAYKCDFDVTYWWTTHPLMATRSNETQQHWLQFNIEAAQDVVATLTKK